jgi:hypothetical protein
MPLIPESEALTPDEKTSFEPKFNSPEERTIWLLRAYPRLRNRTAFNLFCHENNLTPLDGAKVWYHTMLDTEQEEWERRAIEQTEAYHKLGPAARWLCDRIATLRILRENDDRYEKLMEENSTFLE